MDPLTWLLVAGAGALAVGAWVFSLRYAKAFRRAADALGLHTGPRAVTLDGEIDGCQVVARRASVEGQRVTEIVVHPEPRLPAGVALGAEGLLQAVLRTVAGQDVLTGDRAFDNAVLVKGDPPMVLAMLDAANRRMVRRLVNDGAVLDGGELRMTGSTVQSDQLTETIRRLVRGANALRLDPTHIPDRLLQRLRRDPLPDVRRRALELLLARFPESPQTADALASALGDRDPDLRLMAARQTRLDTHPSVEATLRALIADTALDHRLRLETLDLLIERLGSRRASPLLVELLDAPALAGDAASRLARTGRIEALPALCARLHRADVTAAPQLVAAIGALGDARDPALEPALLPLLEDRALQPAVAEALVRVGSQRAIAHLLPLTEGILANSDVKTSARRAIEAIRARRGDGETGGLSMVSSDTADRSGQLSVALEPGGLALGPPSET